MITLTPPGPPLDRALSTALGGFCWWYVDVIDEAGNGVVLIAALGLPFLPGLAGRARAGAPVAPVERPAVNLAVYERGRCTWYGLVEERARAPDALQETGTPGRAGVVVERGSLRGVTFERRVVDDDAVFAADVDLRLPVGSARGRIEVHGRARSPAEHGSHTVGTQTTTHDGLPRHEWSPQILHARGHVDLELGDGAAARHVVVDGAGYHDRNGGRAPLHDLGIAWWLWGRAAFADEERVVYALWPTDGGPVRAFGVVVDDRGSRVVPDLRVDLRAHGTNWFGMRRVSDVAFTDAAGAPFLRARVRHVVDSGPFYERGLWSAARDVDGVHDDDVIRGTMETVDPARVDRPWQRPFVRMRVVPPSPASSSMWLPLFAGDVRGRVPRLLRSLVGVRP